MLNTKKVDLSLLYDNRIKKLYKDKSEMNAQKIRLIGRGHMDFDDWGFIHYPEFVFSYPSDRDDGVICGPASIGKALRSFMNTIPSYVNSSSALAGAWVGAINNWVKIQIAPEDYPDELTPVWEKYDTIPGFGGMNHCAPDMNIGLKLGWGGLLEKIRFYRIKNHPADTSFYDGEEQVVLGMQEWIAGLVREARKMLEDEKKASGDRSVIDNLSEIADMNEWLIENPPRTMREACQFIAHFQTIDRTYFLGGALQQIDELLRTYFERDQINCIITDEQAVWYIASLFYNDTHYSQIAGLTPDGSSDMTSRLSFLVLDAMHLLHIPVNVALRVHDKVDPDLLRRSLEYIYEDGTGVDFSLNIGCEKGYARNGYPISLARQRAKVGCNWTALPGREYPLQDVTRANLGFALHYAIEDMRWMNDADRSLETLFDRFAYHTQVIVNSIKAGYDRHYQIMGRNKPEMVYNLFMHGPIESGLNCSEGGVDILDFNIDGVALATVADSFAAIERRLINEKRLTWAELFELLDSNYENAEDVRLMMKNILRFGNQGSAAESWALRIRDCFVNACIREGTPKYNFPVIPGMFSHGNIAELGAKLPATPNGRRAGEPISHSNEPDPGFARGVDSFSPSLKANAVALAQPGYGNSAPLQLDIDAKMLAREGGIEALMALIHTHNHMGGTLINLNCLTRQKLEAAHENPDLYPDLLIRVTGYSAFFTSLSKEYRQQIIDRFLAPDEI
jgi:pyruvate-formate lyase